VGVQSPPSEVDPDGVVPAAVGVGAGGTAGTGGAGGTGGVGGTGAGGAGGIGSGGVGTGGAGGGGGIVASPKVWLTSGAVTSGFGGSGRSSGRSSFGVWLNVGLLRAAT
jgi:hypothetical protein